MKPKVIRSVLKTRFEKYLESIDDKGLRAEVRRNAFITGGAIVSLFLGEPINDLDVYFDNNETALKVTNYYVERFKSSHEDVVGLNKAVIRPDGEGVDVMVDYDYGVIRETDYKFDGAQGNYRPVMFTSNAITLVNKNPETHGNDVVQLITRFTGSPDRIHENFDFVHCTNTYVPLTNELVLQPDAVLTLLTKELRYVGSKYPICSIFRSRKYIERGWTINAGQYLKMCFQVNELDLHNIDVLRDQLVGVDAAYFEALLKRLPIDGTLDDTGKVCKLIDEIFDEEAPDGSVRE